MGGNLRGGQPVASMSVPGGIFQPGTGIFQLGTGIFVPGGRPVTNWVVDFLDISPSRSAVPPWCVSDNASYIWRPISIVMPRTQEVNRPLPYSAEDHSVNLYKLCRRPCKIAIKIPNETKKIKPKWFPRPFFTTHFFLSQWHSIIGSRFPTKPRFPVPD
jgi:hypothetical protein